MVNGCWILLDILLEILSLLDKVFKTIFSPCAFSVACCWRWNVYRGIQPRCHSTGLQHQEEKQGRRDQHLPWWYLPLIYVFYQTRVYGCPWRNIDCRWWCYPLIYFQDKEKEILADKYLYHFNVLLGKRFCDGCFLLLCSWKSIYVIQIWLISCVKDIYNC